MSTKAKKIDRLFLFSVITLTITGFIVFLSASLGLLAQDGVSFGTVAMKQTISLILGIIMFFIFSRINHNLLRKLAFFILLGAVIANLLLFFPGIALYHGGASRWINVGPLSFQPSEFMKIAFIIYVAAWAHFVKDKIKMMKFGLLPYVAIMILLTFLLLAQSDTDTLVIIGFTGMVMLLVAGLPIRHFLISLLIMAVVVGGVIYFRPYAKQRFMTFLHRGGDAQGAGYQINQSLIAIGSGQIAGRGFGQSIQKFGYLPQPTDDSVFAVAAEEFGFIGSIILISLYIIFAISCFRIGTRSKDLFGGLLAIGIAILIVTESFMNISAMLGLLPLSGIPLLFVSHGGTALIVTLGAAGMIGNVSRES